MTARALMFQGTGSDVGKSLLVAGLARAYARRGLRVRPFKPQNMSNNAAVTADGGEIGRAQALQALAAGVAPSVHMNPVLLKPQSMIGAQVVVQGTVIGASSAADWQTRKKALLPAVLDSFARLKAEADLVLVEGAGSASEINLRAGDIANMGFARAAGVPVVLIGDIDRGGVIASVVGTQAVLEADDAMLIKGFVINKFRGDPALFTDGMAMIAACTGWAALGLVPHFPAAARLPAEDAMALVHAEREAKNITRLKVAVPILPRIANFDDLDPLEAEPSIEVIHLRPGMTLPVDTDLVLLPGSKATIADLAALRAEGWDIDILAHARRGGRVLGLCGGYQMMGRTIADPDGVEGPPATVPGLELLAVDTVLSGAKRLTEAHGTTADGVAVAGYEMHMGRTTGPDTARPFATLDDGTAEGAVSPCGRLQGSYLHGLFADDAQRGAWLARLGGGGAAVAYAQRVEETLNALADHLEAHMPLDRVLDLAR